MLLIAGIALFLQSIVLELGRFLFIRVQAFWRTIRMRRNVYVYDRLVLSYFLVEAPLPSDITRVR